MSALEIETIESKLLCDECRSERVFVETGAVCPNGHGRIHMMEAGDIKRMRKRLAFLKLPEALRIDNRLRYTISGKDGEYRGVRKNKETGLLPEGSIKARYGDKRRFFVVAPIKAVKGRKKSASKS